MDGDEAVSFPIAALPIAPDGSFRIGPFAPGDVDVWLAVKPGFTPSNMPYRPGEYDPPMHHLGRVRVGESGDRRESFDLSATFPAHVRLTARIDDQPAAGAWLRIVDATSGEHLATQIADLEGSATLGPFFATAARALVSDPAGAWFAYGEESVTPPPGGVCELAASVAAAPGRLTLTNAQGQPLADEIVCIYHETPFGWWWAQPLVRTDATGGVELVVPPRRLRLTYVGEAGAWMLPKDGSFVTFMGEPPYPPQPDESMPLVEWTAAGPQPATVGLTR
jgi:hypothetical protein